MIVELDLPHYTAQDYEQWEGRWEIIKGIPFTMSPLPTKKHQRLNVKLVRLLDEALEQTDCDDCVAMMPIDWKIDDDTIVQPDASVICENLEGRYLSSVPKVVFEILSPSTRQKDLITKYALYEKNGVKFYVIVDPDNQIIIIFQLIENQYTKAFESCNQVFVFQFNDCQFSLDFSKIWV